MHHRTLKNDGQWNPIYIKYGALMICIKNPNTRSFTWSKNHPFIFCRLDYWLISDKLNDLVTQVDIQASVKTDHSSIILELEEY